MMVSPVLHADGTVTTQNTLAEQRWFEPVIWIFMVMPLFFVTGGMTGLESWRRLSANGGTAALFIRARLLRLVRPATALLAAMFLGLSAAQLFGVHPQVIGLMAAGAGMPLWFLAAYLAAQLNIPLLAAFHARAPWRTFLVLTALVVAVDCLRGGLPLLANINLLFLWCAVQQMGFLIADGKLARFPRSGLAAVALAANVLLGAVTGLGLYTGNMLVNLNPPNLTLLLLGASQAALMEAARPVLAGVASWPWLSRVLQTAGARSLTVYLWHLPLLAAMSGLLLLAPVPKPESGTPEWWWARAVVLPVLLLLLLPVIAAFGRLEDTPTATPGSGAKPAAVGAAVVVVFLPVADAALGGLSLALLGTGAALFALTQLILGAVPWRSPVPGRTTAAARVRRRAGRRRGRKGIASGVK